MFVNTLAIPILCMPQALVLMPTSLGEFGPTSFSLISTISIVRPLFDQKVDNILDANIVGCSR